VHDETEIRLNEGPLGFVAALDRSLKSASLSRRSHGLVGGETLPRRRSCFDLLREACFVFFGEKWILADVVKIEAEGVFLVSLDARAGPHDDSLAGA
jgi:hypothetical protein